MDDTTQLPAEALRHKVIRLDNGLTALIISQRSRTQHFAWLGCDASLQTQDSTTDQEFTDSWLPTGPAPVIHGSSKRQEHIDVRCSERDVEAACEQNILKTIPVAAALCVAVGSFHDPGRLQGLAHLLEHAVVVASEKYPEKNSMATFLNEHGGRNYSRTHRESTVFGIEVPQEFLQEALDRFANIFIAPLITKESMEVALETVQSEFHLQQASDGVRIQQLFGSLACDGHPMRKFMCGNLRTLRDLPAEDGIDVTAELKLFFDEHYSSERMTLAVISQRSGDDLENMVNTTFSMIPVRLAKQRQEFIRSLSETPFPFDRFSYVLYRVKPLEKTNKLSVTWALPSVVHEYKVKPIQYIAWLCGSHGPGSILAYLRERSWAEELFAGNTRSSFEHNSLCSLFNVFVSLTEDGLKHLNKVLAAIFGFMTMIRNRGSCSSIFDEVKKVGEINSKCRGGMNPLDYTIRLSQNMLVYPPEHYFTGDDCFYEYNPELIQLCMDIMVPEKANIIVLSPHYHKRGTPVHEEPYMGTKYTIDDIPEDWKIDWANPTPDPNFRFPSANKYIGNNFSTRSETQYLSEIPTKVVDNERCRLWFKFGANFNDPRSCVYVHLISPTLHESPTDTVMLSLFADILKQNTQEETGTARRGLLGSSMYITWCGLVMKVYGLSDKHSVLLDDILDSVINFRVSDGLLERAKKELHQNYEKSIMKPSNLAEQVRLSLVRQSYWSDAEKSACLKGVTAASLRRFVKSFRNRLLTEVLAIGNISSAEARQIAEYIVQKLDPQPLPSGDVPRPRVLQIPNGSHYCRVASFRSDDPSSVVTNYYQLGKGDIGQHALSSVMIDIMEHPCVDYLGKRSRLGYRVRCQSKDTFGIVGFVITVCFSAKEHSPTFVDDEIEAFLRKISAKIQGMTEDMFQYTLSSSIKRSSCPDAVLKEEADMYWEEITSMGYVFDRIRQEAEFLKRLTLEDFKAWSISLLPLHCTGVSRRRKISVQVVGLPDRAHHVTPHFNTSIPAPSSNGPGVKVASVKTQNSHVCTREGPCQCSSKCSLESSSEGTTYRLQFLEPRGDASRVNVITDVAKFKKGLSVYHYSEPVV